MSFMMKIEHDEEEPQSVQFEAIIQANRKKAMESHSALEMTFPPRKEGQQGLDYNPPRTTFPINYSSHVNIRQHLIRRMQGGGAVAPQQSSASEPLAPPAEGIIIPSVPNALCEPKVPSDCDVGLGEDASSSDEAAVEAAVEEMDIPIIDLVSDYEDDEDGSTVSILGEVPMKNSDEDCLMTTPWLQYLNPSRPKWNEQEEEIFMTQFLQHYKKFGVIQTYLPGRTVMDVVQYYYLHKKDPQWRAKVGVQELDRLKGLFKKPETSIGRRKRRSWASRLSEENQDELTMDKFGVTTRSQRKRLLESTPSTSASASASTSPPSRSPIKIPDLIEERRASRRN